MKAISGILDAYGPSIGHLGGMKYNYVTIRHDDGRITNLSDIVAYPNVQAALARILDRDEDGRWVTLHTKGALFIYALEEQDGPVHSDIDTIKGAWLGSFAYAFGPWLIAALLFSSGSKQLGIGGFILTLFGFITVIKYFQGIFIFWPGFGAGALHRRSKQPPARRNVPSSPSASVAQG